MRVQMKAGELPVPVSGLADRSFDERLGSATWKLGRFFTLRSSDNVPNFEPVRIAQAVSGEDGIPKNFVTRQDKCMELGQ